MYFIKGFIGKIPKKTILKKCPQCNRKLFWIEPCDKGDIIKYTECDDCGWRAQYQLREVSTEEIIYDYYESKIMKPKNKCICGSKYLTVSLVNLRGLYVNFINPKPPKLRMIIQLDCSNCRRSYIFNTKTLKIKPRIKKLIEKEGKMKIEIYKTKNKKHNVSIRDIDFYTMTENNFKSVGIEFNNKEIARFMSDLWDYCFSKKKTIMKEYNNIRKK